MGWDIFLSVPNVWKVIWYERRYKDCFENSLNYKGVGTYFFTTYSVDGGRVTDYSTSIFPTSDSSYSLCWKNGVYGGNVTDLCTDKNSYSQVGAVLNPMGDYIFLLLIISIILKVPVLMESELPIIVLSYAIFMEFIHINVHYVIKYLHLNINIHIHLLLMLWMM